jgi:hypothetical protein
VPGRGFDHTLDLIALRARGRAILALVYTMRGSRSFSLLYLLLGWLFLGAGAIGVALPGLPTTPFVLLAAWFFSMGSPRLERWLRQHPRFGPTLREWRERRALSLGTKVTATLFKALAVVLFYVTTGELLWAAILAVLLGGISLYLWSRPTIGE